MIHASNTHFERAEEVVLTRIFDAPRDLVFKVWTDPRYVALWWGVNGATNVVHQMDVRPGGQWRIDMTVENGTTYPNCGEFLEVIENERLSYTHVHQAESPAWKGAPPEPTTSTVEFEPHGPGTLVRMKVHFASEEDMQRMAATGLRRGLEQGFDRFAALLAKLTDPRKPGR